MFDKAKYRQKLLRASSQNAKDPDFLIRHASEEVLERVGAVSRDFDTGLAVFARSPALAEAMTINPQIKSVQRIEDEIHQGIADKVSSLENLDLERNSYDIAVAPLTLHWSNDLPGTLIQLHTALKPDGLLMAVLPGPDTLHELRDTLLIAESEITGGAAVRIDPFTDIQGAGTLLQRAGFALPVVDEEAITVRYNDVFALIRDLRAFGATLHLDQAKNPPLSKGVVKRMAEIYKSKYSDPDGRIRATFTMIFLSGWVPHESQQKALRRGSATNSLAEALGTDEHKL